MKWYSNDPTPPSGENGNGGSGGSGSSSRQNTRGIFRLKIFQGMDKGRDILYLGDEVFRFWEHHGKDSNGKWSPGVHAICRRRNNIADGACPPCDELAAKGKDKASINLYNIGFYTSVDISFGVGKEYRGERNLYLMEKRLVGAKAGTQDHPGPLADLNRIRERHGRLKGLVIHQIRKGAKSPTIGDSFEVIEKLNPTPEAMLEYLKFRVNQMLKDGTIKRACDEAGIGMPNKEFYQEKILKMDLSPYDYEQIFQPVSASELADMFNVPYTRQQGAQPSVPPDQPDDPFTGGGFDYGDGGRETDASPFDGAPGPGYAEGQPDDQEDMPF